MTDQHLIRAEGMSVRATCRWVGDPLPGRGLYELAEHAQKHMALPAT